MRKIMKKKGQRSRKRERVYGTIIRRSSCFENSWFVRFTNGKRGVFRETQLKFDNNLELMHTLASSSNKKLSLKKADSVSIKGKKVSSQNDDKSKKKLKKMMNVLKY